MKSFHNGKVALQKERSCSFFRSDEPFLLLFHVVPRLPLQDGSVRVESICRALVLSRDVLSLVPIEVSVKKTALLSWRAEKN